jgi:hypothetical protein
MSDELPDDTLLSDVLLTNRVRRTLINEKIMTVGELRGLTDDYLSRLPDFGEIALLEVRLLTGQVKPGSKGIRSTSDSALKQRWVRAVHRGECKCSFEEWRRDVNS